VGEEEVGHYAGEGESAEVEEVGQVGQAREYTGDECGVRGPQGEGYVRTGLVILDVPYCCIRDYGCSMAWSTESWKSAQA
jgi:hypothetical protein